MFGIPRSTISAVRQPFLLCSVTAYADTHWVNLSGSNEALYASYATGANKIQDAIDQAVAGDTVSLGEGEYDIDTTISVWDSLALVGAGIDSAELSFIWSTPGMYKFMMYTEGYN